jgi:hypothetical protein
MPTIAEHRHARSELIERLADVLAKDARFPAAWLYGSLGRGDSDAMSDIDLALVVSEAAAPEICRRPWMSAAHTTPERLALFRLFGEPALIHENHHNASPGGTFTCTIYTGSGLTVDWMLRPLPVTLRPANTRLLFDKIGIPLEPPVVFAPPAKSAEELAELCAFFWMMASITAKYIYRQDQTFVIAWLGRLVEMVEEVEERAGREKPAAQWLSGLSVEDLANALRGLSARMEACGPPAANPAARAELERLLRLALGEKKSMR